MIGKYNFSSLGFDGEYDDPVIVSIPRSGISMNETEMKIDADIVLSGSGYKIGFRLVDIVVNDFNYDQDQLIQRVESRLKDFKV